MVPREEIDAFTEVRRFDRGRVDDRLRSKTVEKPGYWQVASFVPKSIIRDRAVESPDRVDFCHSL